MAATFNNFDLSCIQTSNGAFQVFLAQLISTLLKAPCDIPSQYPIGVNPETIQKRGIEFDFIVVGAGSSGSVVANRLSEIAEWNVLLIEEGDDPPIESDIPAMFPFVMDSLTSWQFQSDESDGYCQASIDKKCFCPRGKGLGGSSVINFLIYTRGNTKDYDRWKDLGNNGWDYDSVLPYFKKLEKLNVDGLNPDLHNKEGYLNVGRFSETIRKPIKILQEALVRGASELGFSTIDDSSVNITKGIGKVLTTIKDGVRQSVSKAYLSPIRNRQNLFVLKKAHVTKILIDSKKRAYGVTVFKDNAYTNFVAKNEIILSAGALNSPHILMLSGIGPEDHLAKFGINVIQDLKVGYNLQDHVLFTGLIYSYKANYDIPDEKLQILDDIYHYLTRRQELGSIAGMNSVLYEDTTSRQPHYPDIQTYFLKLPAKSLQLSTLFNVLRIQPEIIDSVMNIEGDYLLIPGLILLRPKSRGRVYLKSTNPFDALGLDLAYFTDNEDREVLLKGIHSMLNLNRTAEFQRQNITLTKLNVSECQSVGEDKYWECMTKYMSTTTYHVSGTCKMGPKTDPSAVVDSNLKVHGIEGLRVVDASIMPNIVSGNTNVPCVMIGERGSDMIKAEWLSNVKNKPNKEEL